MDGVDEELAMTRQVDNLVSPHCRSSNVTSHSEHAHSIVTVAVASSTVRHLKSYVLDEHIRAQCPPHGWCKAHSAQLSNEL